MNKHLIATILLLTLALTPSVSFAGKKPAAPPPPSAEAQKAMTDRFYQALDGGSRAYGDLVNEVTNHGTAEDVKMLDNLSHGKAADGGPRKGFRGDPNDPGPSDWSDWNIETDSKGNVTGFKEKDFDQKDADGDGEISKGERDAWNKEKKKQDDERGGPVGDNYHPPDWDKDEDGKPDPDFTRDCWKCRQPVEHRCKDGDSGPCGEGACSDGMECFEHTETDDTVSMICHTCGPTETITTLCGGYGFSDDPSCNGECADGACVAIDVDKSSGQVVPAGQTRERGSTQTCFRCEPKESVCAERGLMDDPSCGGSCPAGPCVTLQVDKSTGRIVPSGQTRERGSTQDCYQCMTVERITIRYVVIIIETARYRVILDKSGKTQGTFVPSSVMVLADKDKLEETLKRLSPLAGGLDPNALLQNALGMDKVSDMLHDALAKSGKFTDECFGAFKSLMPPLPSILPPSFGAKASKMAEVLSPSLPGGSAAGLPGVDALSQITSLGPVVACGMSGADKVLQVFDANGRTAATLSKDDAKSKPQAVLDALKKAQQLSEQTLGFAANPVGSVWKAMLHSSADPEQVSDEEDYPDDPYYTKSPQAKKKHKKVKVSFGADGFAPDAASRDLQERQEKQAQAPDDQWGLKKIGYLPKSDPDSAWNVIDGQQRNVIVAVIDSGFDMTHPDGPQYVWTNAGEIPDNGMDDDGNGYVDDVHGWNFIDDNPRLTDGRGHGTFVAGIIAAKTNNGEGIAGINPGAVIMPLKVADDQGETDSLKIFRAVLYAVDNGASVINVSLGSRVPSDLEVMALNYARQHDVFVAAASGNVNEDIGKHGPASASGAFAVGAIDRVGTRSTVSNWGANNGLLAPGEQIYSLLSADKVDSVLPSLKKLGIYPMSGTSFSTPMVAATASLIRAAHPEYTADQVEDILHVTADDMGDPGWDGENGAGLLNAAKALRHEPSASDVLAKIVTIRYNTDNKKLQSVDVFVTARGGVKDYMVELGKGKHARKFQPVSATYTQPVTNGWAARIRGNEFNGSDDWTIRLSVTDPDGKVITAEVVIDLSQK